jgi:urease accessory protein
MSGPRARAGADAAPGPTGGGRSVAARLDFAREAGGATFLHRARTPYPFHITRPFRLAGDPPGMATLYLQSAAGGVYAGDALSLDISAAPGTAAHVTTQASTIVHAARTAATAPARVVTRIHVGADALLEWLPEPTILLADARLDSRTELVLADGAVALVGEALLSHAPWDAGGTFDRFDGALDARTHEGRRIAHDRMLVDGRAWRDGGAAALGGARAHAVLFALGRPAASADLERLRAAVAAAAPAAYAGVSALRDDHGWCARVLAGDAVELRRATDALWRCAREILTGRAPPARPK